MRNYEKLQQKTQSTVTVKFIANDLTFLITKVYNKSEVGLYNTDVGNFVTDLVSHETKDIKMILALWTRVTTNIICVKGE